MALETLSRLARAACTAGERTQRRLDRCLSRLASAVCTAVETRARAACTAVFSRALLGPMSSDERRLHLSLSRERCVDRWRANLQHTSQSRPDAGVGFSRFQYEPVSSRVSRSMFARKRAALAIEGDTRCAPLRTPPCVAPPCVAPPCSTFSRRVCSTFSSRACSRVGA